MAQAAHPVRFSFAEYVALERSSNVKHEHLNGQIFAMAGGTPEHAALTAAASGLLFAQLRGRPCRVYSSDLRVRAADLTTYPDVTVVCGDVERDAADPNTARNPKVVVEVTSPNTEDYDRGEKLQSYQQIPGLAAILVISHREAQVELWSRSATGWSSTIATRGGRVEVPAIGCLLEVDDLYAVTA